MDWLVPDTAVLNRWQLELIKWWLEFVRCRIDRFDPAGIRSPRLGLSKGAQAAVLCMTVMPEKFAALKNISPAPTTDVL